MPAPGSHTCPKIDRVIDEIKEAQKIANEIRTNFNNITPQEIKDKLRDLNDLLDNLHWSKSSDLEEIRSANEALREWGLDLENEKEELESELREERKLTSDLCLNKNLK